MENLLLCVIAEMRGRIYRKEAVPGGGIMEIILLAVSASMFEGSDSGVGLFDPECEDIMVSDKAHTRNICEELNFHWNV